MFAYGLSPTWAAISPCRHDARLKDDGKTVVINGTKRWHGQGCRLAVLLCKPAPTRRAIKISMILVPAKSKGISVNVIEHSCIR